MPVCFMIIRIFFMIFGFFSVSACSFQAPVNPSSAGAAAVMPSRVSQIPVLLVVGDFEPGLRQVRPGALQCSAHNYPLDIRQALFSSLRSTTLAAYPNLRVARGSESARPGEARINVTLDSVEARLRFLPGFWQATASANVEVALNVQVTDSRNRDVYRGIALGTGSEEVAGACPDGANALGEAASKAIRRVVQDFVSKAINPHALN